MAYDRAKIEKKAIEVIQKEELTFFGDLQIYLEPALSTLYEWGLEESEDIKKALAVNKLKKKKKMRIKWEESDNPGLQIAAYKLYANEDELNRLTANKHELTGKEGGPIQTENTLKVEVYDFSNGSENK